MNLLKHLLTVVAFAYMCYHIYNFGPGMFNVTVLVVLILSTVANYCLLYTSGTGPYVVKSFTKERAEMAANEKYWDGAVPFKTVEIPSIDDPNTRALSLQSGDVDMAVNIGPGRCV